VKAERLGVSLALVQCSAGRGRALLSLAVSERRKEKDGTSLSSPDRKKQLKDSPSYRKTFGLVEEEGPSPFEESTKRKKAQGPL